MAQVRIYKASTGGAPVASQVRIYEVAVSGIASSTDTFTDLYPTGTITTTQVVVKRATSWNVQAIGVRIYNAALPGALPSTTTQVIVTRSTSYKVRQEVAFTRNVQWAVHTSVTATRTTLWKVRNTVTALRGTTWDVHSRVKVTVLRGTSWNLRARLVVTRGTHWNVAQGTVPITPITPNGNWRVIAQRVRTGEFLHWDIPLDMSTTSRELSGPGGVFGTVHPVLLEEEAADGRPLLEEWSTALYVEEGGVIKGGGIISKIDTEGTSRALEASGFTAYPQGIPYRENYLPDDFPDPTKVIKDLWEYVQSFPNGNLGMSVTAPETWMVLSNGTGPFVMRDFEYRDCGDTINQIATAVPLDYTETHEWNADCTAIIHKLVIGFPRLGRKRDEMTFRHGENVVSFGVINTEGDLYANDVYVYGQGSGSAMPSARASVDDGRLRRCAVIQEPTTAGEDFLKSRARGELAARAAGIDIADVTIRDHVNARISAIAPGDDILFEAEVPYYGMLRRWLRVLAINESGDAPGIAVLKTQRSDSFTYAAATSPTGDKVPIVV